mmetsp:Transcript_10394/g.27010  ORF Transcript_10394/g.27010 Transcript_10394/m.27010 type:complete len:365 (-) Transcript_10394:6-1100(-)
MKCSPRASRHARVKAAASSRCFKSHSFANMYCVSMPTSSVRSPLSRSTEMDASSVPDIHAASGSARPEVMRRPGMGVSSGTSMSSVEKIVPKPMFEASMLGFGPRSSLIGRSTKTHLSPRSASGIFVEMRSRAGRARSSAARASLYPGIAGYASLYRVSSQLRSSYVRRVGTVRTGSSESATPIMDCISDRKKRTCVGRTSARSMSACTRLRSSRELMSEDGSGSTCRITPFESQTSSSHSFLPASLVTGRVYRSSSQMGEGFPLRPERGDDASEAGAAAPTGETGSDGGGVEDAMRTDERDTGTRADAREAASPDIARACASAVTVRAIVVIMADAPDPVPAVAPSTASISPVGSPGPLIVQC